MKQKNGIKQTFGKFRFGDKVTFINILKGNYPEENGVVVGHRYISGKRKIEVIFENSGIFLIDIEELKRGWK